MARRALTEAEFGETNDVLRRSEGFAIIVICLMVRITEWGVFPGGVPRTGVAGGSEASTELPLVPAGGGVAVDDDDEDEPLLF